MRASEFIIEVFQPGKKNWEWLRRGSEEANAQFQVGDREYRWDAFTQRGNPTKWEIQFRLIRNDTDPSDLDLFGRTGTGNSAQVLSTAVDITRAFLEYYGLDKVEEITFNAKEDSRIGLYAKMIKRLLPNWDLYQKYTKDNGMEYHLTDRRAYNKPQNKLSEEAKAVKYNGLVLKYAFNDNALLMKAFIQGSPIAYVKFVREGSELYPQDLWVNDDYRNKGIAKSMYDYLKSAGYIVNRSHDQTKAGAGFWDKHRGEDSYVWEDAGNTTTLAQLYNGNYPDRDEIFWDYVNSSELEMPLNIQTLQRHKVLLTLLGQYRVEHIDDIMDMLDDDRKELVQSYVDDPNLSSKVIVLSGHKIIDGNHRALAAAIKGVPINYVDLADLEELEEMVSSAGVGHSWTGDAPYRHLVELDDLDEGWKDVAVGAAMGLGALGVTNAAAKPEAPVQRPAITQPATYNLLSNNPTNEITILKTAKKAGMKGAELAQFLAQMKHESWDFDRLKEKAQPGVKDYFAKKYDAKYAPKTAKILGNKHAGDGARYHGRGFVQLTGRDNYRMAGDALGIDLLNHPELAEKPEIAAKIALWYWNTRVKPNVRNFADTASVTKYINPALKGVQGRDENFKDYMRII